MANVIKSIKLGSTGTATPVISTVGATFLASGVDMRVDLVKNDSSITRLAGVIPAATLDRAGLLTAGNQNIGGVKTFVTESDLSINYDTATFTQSVEAEIEADLYEGETSGSLQGSYYTTINQFIDIPERFMLTSYPYFNYSNVVIKNSQGEDITSIISDRISSEKEYTAYCDNDGLWVEESDRPLRSFEDYGNLKLSIYIEYYGWGEFTAEEAVKLQHTPWTMSQDITLNYYTYPEDLPQTNISKSGLAVSDNDASTTLCINTEGIRFNDIDKARTNIISKGSSGLKIYSLDHNGDEEGIVIDFSRNSHIGNTNMNLSVYSSTMRSNYGYISYLYATSIYKQGTTGAIGQQDSPYNMIYSREYLNGTVKNDRSRYGYTYIYPVGQTVYYQVGLTNTGITGSIGSSYSSMQFGYINNIFTRALYPEDSPRHNIDEYNYADWGDSSLYKDVGATARPHIKVGMGSGNAKAGFTNLYFFPKGNTTNATAAYVWAQYSLSPALYPYKDTYGYIGLTDCKFLAGNFVTLYANSFYESSDENLKNILKPIETDLEELSKLRKVYFEWKDNSNGITGPQLGIIAQDIKKLYPEIVDGEEGGLTVQYDKLGVIALDAVDKLYQENKELKARCESLEKRVQRLENLLM